MLDTLYALLRLGVAFRRFGASRRICCSLHIFGLYGRALDDVECHEQVASLLIHRILLSSKSAFQ